MMIQVYGDNCLSRSRVHEWYKRFSEGRESLEDDEHVGQPKFVITPNNIEKVREFIKREPKSSVRYMEMELNISKDSIHRILTEVLGLRKVCARYVPHKLTDDQKLLRIQRFFLTKNHIFTINHSPYSPDLAPCDFYLFGKLHLPMKGQRYADVNAIQKAATTILKDFTPEELKSSFDMLLDRATRCINSEGDYFE